MRFLGIFVLLGVMGCTADLDSLVTNRIHLVDQKGQNYLFRGGDPVLHGKTFDYDGLMKTFSEQIPDQDLSNVELIDVSLLFIEVMDIHAEHSFFQHNPEKGFFLNIPIFGSIADNEITRVIEETFDDDDIKELLIDLLGQTKADKLWSELSSIIDITEREAGINLALDKIVVDKLHSLLGEKTKRPRIIYVHCVAGCDRTGEVIGGYRMMHHNHSFSLAKNKNDLECGRPQNSYSLDAMHRYCLAQNTEKPDKCEGVQ